MPCTVIHTSGLLAQHVGIESVGNPALDSFFLSRACVALNADLNTLDGEFNKLSEHVAKGERDDHSPASLNRMMSH